MRPDFKNIDYKADIKPAADPKGWEKENGIRKDWCTSEQIHVKGVYLDTDLLEMEHLNYASGLPPYLRGPYSTMYVMKPWTIRQYAGFSTAEESNAFYHPQPGCRAKGPFRSL